jgi:hypothetical protein
MIRDMSDSLFFIVSVKNTLLYSKRNENGIKLETQTVG